MWAGGTTALLVARMVPGAKSSDLALQLFLFL